MVEAREDQGARLLRALREVLALTGGHVAVLRALLEQAAIVTGASRGALVEVAGDGGLHYRALHGFGTKGVKGSADRDLRRKIEAASRPGAGGPGRSGAEASTICAPIRTGDVLAGILYLEAGPEAPFGEKERAQAAAFTAVAAPAFEAVRGGWSLMREAIGAGGQEGAREETRAPSAVAGAPPPGLEVEEPDDPPPPGGPRTASSGLPLDVGLPALQALAEMQWLEEAIRQHPGLTRAQLASLLRISERALYKKLRLYGIES